MSRKCSFLNFAPFSIAIAAFSICLSVTCAQAEEIAALQELLTKAQCDPGPVDGLWGGKTRSALSRVQFGTNLTVERPITPEDVATLEDAGLSCAPPRDTLEYVEGPFRASLRNVSRTDVRQLGCPQCDPIPRILAAPDLDGDGIPELVLAMESFDLNRRPNDVPIDILVLNLDGSPYEGFVGAPARIHARTGIVADFNGDGVDDFFIAAHGQDGPPFNGERNVLALSQPDGTHLDVSDTHLPQLDVMSHGAAAGDIDGDGDIDIVVVTNAQGGRARLSNHFLINDGEGHLTLSEGENHLPPGLPRRVDRFLAATLADVDGDGFIDLIFTGKADRDTASILMLGDGKGHFGEPVTLPRPDWDVPQWTTDVKVLDLDGDGDSDLVLLHTGTFEGQPFKGLYIQTLMNVDMQFRDETAMRIWPQDWDSNRDFHIAHAISFADLDEDGDLDFVVQSLNPVWEQQPGDLPAQIGLNRGDGVFDPVRADWMTKQPYNGRQLMLIRINGEMTLVGNALFGENTSDGFRTFGHLLQLLRR